MIIPILLEINGQIARECDWAVFTRKILFVG